MTVTKRVRVVVVEDSLVQRAHLVRTLEADGDIAVVGEAVRGDEAVAAVGRLRPDVVTLDLEIPGGGGLLAIEQIMAITPTPILVLSGSFADRHSTPAVEALIAGAVDALPKPVRWTARDEVVLRRTVRSLHGVTVVRRHRRRLASPPPAPRASTEDGDGGRQVVAIAASTGGPPALAEVLSGLTGLRAPVLVVQHLHPEFVEGLVSWMARVSGLAVCLARRGERVEPGTVYIGPGGTHLRLGSDRRIVLAPDPVTVHRPSADELFSSVAEHAGADGVAAVLTGMGDDGAAGLLSLREAGGTTIGQDRASCAIFGMPAAAERMGALSTLLPLEQIAGAIVRASRGARL